MAKKYIAYYRVSTRRQGESGLGLESQMSIIDYFVKSDKAEIIAKYTEVRSGATIEKRPKLKEAIERVKKEGAYLIVAKADRLGRDAKEALGIYDDLNEKLMCCDIPNTDRFTLTIFFAVAERERFLTKIRTKGALDAKRKRESKEIINGAPFHKNKVDTKKAAMISGEIRRERSLERQKQLILLAKQLRDDGYTLRKIATSLNHFGYKTQRGKNFTASQISRLLES